MEKRRLGTTGLQVSVFCFGTWEIGGARFGPVEARVGADLILQALEAGVNCFDMANIYGNGRSEVIVGQALRAHRDSVVYVTKAGYLTGLDGAQGLVDPFPQSFEREHIVKSCEDSLRRLQTEYVDVLLLHDPSMEVVQDPDVWETFRSLKRVGKARFIGASAGPDRAVAAIEMGAEVIEVQLNLMKPRASTVVLPLSQARGVGVLARSPFAGGELFRSAPAHEATSLAEAIGFPLSFPAVSGIITGVINATELTQDLAALPVSVAA